MVQKTKYTPEIVEIICEKLSQGETLEDICRDPSMPSSRVVRSWRNGEVKSIPPSVAYDIAHACEAGFDAIAEKTRQVARGDAAAGSKGDVARDKLIIDTDMKLLSKWSNKYADKSQVDVTNSDGSLARMDAKQLAGEIAFIYAEARKKMLEAKETEAESKAPPAGTAVRVVHEAEFEEIYPDDGSDLC